MANPSFMGRLAASVQPVARQRELFSHPTFFGSVGARMANPSFMGRLAASVQPVARQREPFSHPTFWGALEPGWRTRVSWAGSRRAFNQSLSSGSLSRIKPFGERWSQDGEPEPTVRTTASCASNRPPVGAFLASNLLGSVGARMAKPSQGWRLPKRLDARKAVGEPPRITSR